MTTALSAPTYPVTACPTICQLPIIIVRCREDAFLFEQVRILKVLAGRETLTSPELQEAKRVMVFLRREGWTPDEISEFSDQRWNPVTIRQYAKHVRVKKGGDKMSAVDLVNWMMTKGYDFESLEAAKGMQERCDEASLDLDAVGTFLTTCGEWSIGTQEAIATAAKMKSQNVTPEDITRELALRRTVEESGADYEDMLSDFTDWWGEDPGLEATRKARELVSRMESRKLTLSETETTIDHLERAGSPSEVAQEVEALGGLRGIQAATAKAVGEKRGAEEEANQIRKEAEKLAARNEKASAELADKDAALRALRKVESVGWTAESLGALSELSERWGGQGAVLKGVGSYSVARDADEEAARASQRAEVEEDKMKALRTKRAHLEMVVSTVDELMKKGYGVDAIEQIYHTAELHGPPIQVLRKLDVYGRVEDLREEETKLSNRTKEIEGRIVKKEQELASLKAGFAPFLEVVKEGRSLQDFRVIAEASLRFGPTATVLEAVNEYGDVKALHEEKAKLASEVDGLKLVKAEVIGNLDALRIHQTELQRNLDALRQEQVELGTEEGRYRGMLEENERTLRLLRFATTPREFDKAAAQDLLITVLSAFSHWLTSRGSETKNVWTLKDLAAKLLTAVGEA